MCFFAASVALFLHFDGLVQERLNSSALAVELRLSCTNPSIYLLLSVNAVLVLLSVIFREVYIHFCDNEMI